MKKTILFHSVVISFSVLLQILLFLLTAPPWIDIIVSAFTAMVSAAHEICSIFISKKRDKQLRLLKLSFSLKNYHAKWSEESFSMNLNNRGNLPKHEIPTLQTVIDRYRDEVIETATPAIGRKKARKMTSDATFFTNETNRLYAHLKPTDIEIRSYEIQIPKAAKYA